VASESAASGYGASSIRALKMRRGEVAHLQYAINGRIVFQTLHVWLPSGCRVAADIDVSNSF